MKVKLLRSCVLGPGKIGKKGQVVDMSNADARYLVGINKATEDLQVTKDDKKDDDKK